jgi:hypothetical protein
VGNEDAENREHLYIPVIFDAYRPIVVISTIMLHILHTLDTLNGLVAVVRGSVEIIHGLTSHAGILSMLPSCSWLGLGHVRWWFGWWDSFVVSLFLRLVIVASHKSVCGTLFLDDFITYRSAKRSWSGSWSAMVAVMGAWEG